MISPTRESRIGHSLRESTNLKYDRRFDAFADQALGIPKPGAENLTEWLFLKVVKINLSAFLYWPFISSRLLFGEKLIKRAEFLRKFSVIAGCVLEIKLSLFAVLHLASIVESSKSPAYDKFEDHNVAEDYLNWIGGARYAPHQYAFFIFVLVLVSHFIHAWYFPSQMATAMQKSFTFAFIFDLQICKRQTFEMIRYTIERISKLNSLNYIVGVARTSYAFNISLTGDSISYKSNLFESNDASYCNRRFKQTHVKKTYKSFKMILIKLEDQLEPIWPHNHKFEPRISLLKLALLLSSNMSLFFYIFVVGIAFSTVSYQVVEIVPVDIVMQTENRSEIGRQFQEIRRRVNLKELYSLVEFVLTALHATSFFLVPSIFFYIALSDLMMYLSKLKTQFQQINDNLKLFKGTLEVNSQTLLKLNDINTALVSIFIQKSLFISQVMSVKRIGKLLLKCQFMLGAVVTILLVLCNTISTTNDMATRVLPTLVMMIIVNNQLPVLARFRTKCERTLSNQIMSLIANITEIDKIAFTSANESTRFEDSTNSLSSPIFYNYETMSTSLFNPQTTKLWFREAKRADFRSEALTFRVWELDCSKFGSLIGLNAWILSLTVLFLKNTS